MATTPAELVRALRLALNLTQEQVADRSEGKLARVDVNKIESGRNQATSDRVRAGLAQAAGLTRDELADYLDGRFDLEATISRMRERLARSSPPSTDAYPHRAEAARIALAGGVNEAAVRSVLEDRPEHGDAQTVLWWIDRMRLREAMLARDRNEPVRSEVRKRSRSR